MGGTTCIRIKRGGRISVAIRRENDLFHIGKQDGDATALRRRFVEELGSVTDFPDALLAADI